MRKIGYMPLNGGVHGPSDRSSKRPVATGPQPVFLIFSKLGNWQLQSSCDQLRSSPVASLCTSCQLDFETLVTPELTWLDGRQAGQAQKGLVEAGDKQLCLNGHQLSWR